MKKIVPFNNVLNFNTDVREITAISLEHEINKQEDTISGKFFISGEYKMTDGQLEKDKFNFELPFDIALGCNDDLNTLLVDIDDFRYELVDDNKLKVNIDLYIDGQEVEKIKDDEVVDEPLFTEEELREIDDAKEDISFKTEEVNKETVKFEEVPIIDRLDLLDDIIDNKVEDNMKEEETEVSVNNENNNNNINIFNSLNETDEYVTYHVYPVTENDTLDKILEKYNITKEEFIKYNNNLDIHTGDKLIIPANKNDK